MKNLTLILISISVIAQSVIANPFPWEKTHNLEKSDNGFRAVGPGAWLMSGVLSPAVSADHCYMILQTKASTPLGMQATWKNSPVGFHFSRSALFHIPASSESTTIAIDLGQKGMFDGLDTLQLTPLMGSSSNVEFDVKIVKFTKRENIPDELLPAICEFKCFPSKTH